MDLGFHFVEPGLDEFLGVKRHGFGVYIKRSMWGEQFTGLP